MLAKGLAHVFKVGRYSQSKMTEYEKIQEKATADKVGIWSTDIHIPQSGRRVDYKEIKGKLENIVVSDIVDGREFYY